MVTYFSETHGERIAREMGVRLSDIPVDLDGYRAAMGYPDATDRITFRELQERARAHPPTHARAPRGSQPGPFGDRLAAPSSARSPPRLIRSLGRVQAVSGAPERHSGWPQTASGVSARGWFNRRRSPGGGRPRRQLRPRGPAPSSSRRTSAEPTTTPSATSQTVLAWSGVDTPMPMHTGRSVTARPGRPPHGPTRPAPPVRRSPPCARPRRRIPGSAGEGRDPFLRRGGRHQEDGRHPGLVGRSAHGSSSSRADRARWPRSPPNRPGAGHAAVTGPEDQVVVGHHHQRQPTSTRLRSARTPSGVVPRPSARSDASWMVGPSIIGSEKGMPDLDGVGAGVGHGLEGEQPVVVHAAGDVGNEQLVPGRRGEPQGGPAGPGSGSSTHVSSAPPDRISRTWATSLSPRPDRFTRTVEPVGDLGPRPRHHPRDGVGRLQRRDDALGSGQELERVEDLLVVGRVVRARPTRPDGRARDRCPGSRARRRWTRPRGSGPPRPA